MRRRLMQQEIKEMTETTKVRRFKFKPSESQKEIQIPLDFEPQTVLFFDRYPNDYYLENGSDGYGSNGTYSVHIHDNNYEFSSVPYSATAAVASFKNRNTIKYDAGIVTINPYSAFKNFISGHEYTIIIIGEVDEEIFAV